MTKIAISVSEVSKKFRIFKNQRSRFLYNIWPKYKKNLQEIWALKDINIEIRRGESVAIIGRNGSGKSTLLEILIGTMIPTTGKVIVNGRVSGLLELGSGFNPEFSGRENVILNGLLLGLRKSEILKRFNEIENFAEIGNAIDSPVKTYSTGMVMRLAFAVQVLCDPDILIIDEALAVGDFFFQQKCYDYIRKLCEKGVTLLFVSHDMSVVRDLCERGIVLSNGSISYDGDKEKAIQSYLSEQRGLSEQAEFIKDGGDKNIGREQCIDIELIEPIWSYTEKKSKLKAQLIAVGLEDEFGMPIRKIRMGSEVRFLVYYKVNTNEQVHIHIIIKNRYDQIITAVGSFNLKITPPNFDIDQVVIFELKTHMLIEAGNYVFSISLVQPEQSQSTGTIIDETKWIGPIEIYWNYNEEIPPFYGLCGMHNSARFIKANIIKK